MNLKSTLIGTVVAIIVFGLWVWVALSLGVSGYYLLSCLGSALMGALLIGVIVFLRVATGSWVAFGVIAIAVILGLVWPSISVLADLTASAFKTPSTQQPVQPSPSQPTDGKTDDTPGTSDPLIRKKDAVEGFKYSYQRGKEDGRKGAKAGYPASQVAQWKKIVISTTLPAKGEWVIRDDIDLEPGLAYPITGTPPPGFFDYEVFPVLRRYDPTPPFPGDELRSGLVSYLIPTRPGKFGYVLKSDTTCRGVWTFEIGKGIPVNQVREFLVYENRRVYHPPQQ